jgi:hypothetical protein
LFSELKTYCSLNFPLAAGEVPGFAIIKGSFGNAGR